MSKITSSQILKVSYSPYKIIAKKRDGKKLNLEEIEWFIKDFLLGHIPDYQMSALLMAIYLKGFSLQETASLTSAMLNSGKILKFSEKNIVDKHSTGGIGDKTSFIVAPIAAAAGVKVPMIAGRGLGFTGGTIDKVEAISGFKTHLSMDQFIQNLNKFDLVLMGQTNEIAPADKKIYSLRDVTATIDSIPLITASIMSKKLAEGIKGLVLDIKFGEGAFMKNKKRAELLAKSLMETADKFGVHSISLLTDMSQPLGSAVGHSLEIIESVETLKGKGPKDLTQLSLELAGGMIYLAGVASSYKKGIAIAKDVLDTGKALQSFTTLLKSQGGDHLIINDYKRLPLAKNTFPILSTKKGYIQAFDNEEIGFLLTSLGGGRKVVSDKIDHGVGFIFHHKKGDHIQKNDKLVTIFYNSGQESLVEKIAETVSRETIKIGPKKPRMQSLIQSCHIKWSKNV